MHCKPEGQEIKLDQKWITLYLVTLWYLKQKFYNKWTKVDSLFFINLINT